MKIKIIFVMQMCNWLYMKVVLRLYNLWQNDPIPAKSHSLLSIIATLEETAELLSYKLSIIKKIAPSYSKDSGRAGDWIKDIQNSVHWILKE